MLAENDRSILERLLIAVTECELRCRQPSEIDGAAVRPFAEYCARLRTGMVAELALRLLSAGEDPDRIMQGALATSEPLVDDGRAGSWPMRGLATAHEALLWVYDRALAEPVAPDVHAAIRWQHGVLTDAVQRLRVLAFDTADDGLPQPPFAAGTT